MSDPTLNSINEDYLRLKMERRREEFIRYHIKKSQGVGDFHHNQAVKLGAHDDYMPYDHGNEPNDYKDKE